MAKQYFVMGIGGTGMRCIESLLHLCAMGMFDDTEIHLLALDTDVNNGNFGRLKAVKDAYNKAKGGNANTQSALSDTFFSAKINYYQFSPDYQQNRTFNSVFDYNNTKYNNREAADLADLTGVDMETLERYTRLGLITPDLAGYFPARCVQTVSAIARLECAGVDVRVLRAVRQGAERSADIIDQTVSSQRGRGRGADRERARARAVELGELFAELHREMLTVAVSALADDGG